MPTIDRGPSTCWTEISANPASARPGMRSGLPREVHRRRLSPASRRDGWLLARWLELAVVVAFGLVVLVGAVVQFARAD